MRTKEGADQHWSNNKHDPGDTAEAHPGFFLDARVIHDPDSRPSTPANGTATPSRVGTRGTERPPRPYFLFKIRIRETKTNQNK
ncbi:unnamed protein product [Lota lota]